MVWGAMDDDRSMTRSLWALTIWIALRVRRSSQVRVAGARAVLPFRPPRGPRDAVERVARGRDRSRCERAIVLERVAAAFGDLYVLFTMPGSVNPDVRHLKLAMRAPGFRLYRVIHAR